MNILREPDPVYKGWMVGPGQGSAKEERSTRAKALLNDLKERDFDIETLAEILALVDFECLCHDSKENARQNPRGASELAWISKHNGGHFQSAIRPSQVGDFADKLSACLVRYIGAVTHLDREIQCRALLSIFALLRLVGFTAVQADADLSGQINRLFQDLVWQPEDHRNFSPAVFYRVQCSHLLSLVAASVRQIPKAETQMLPAVQCAFALTQFGVIAASTVLGTGLGDWVVALGQAENSVRGLVGHSDAQDYDLIKIQTLTRVSLTLYRYWKLASLSGSHVASDLVERAWRSYTDIGNHALSQILAIWERDENKQFEANFSRPRQFNERLRALFNYGPTALDRYHYFYGLLDCASQLSAILNSPSHPANFATRVGSIIKTSKEESFRWKALEIFLVHADLRSQYLPLVMDTIKQDNCYSEDFRRIVSAEVAVMSQCLGLRASSEFESRRSLERVEMSPSDWKENMVIAPRLLAECEFTSQRLPTKWRLKVQFLTAGLSQNGSHIYFLKDDLIQIYPFQVKSGQTIAEVVFERRLKDVRLCTAVVSESHIVILMEDKARKRSLHLFGIDGSPFGNEPFELDTDGYTWNPAALLALHESDKGTLVAIGGSTKHDNVLTGGIKIFSIAQHPQTGLLLKHSILLKHHKRNIHAPDLVKTLEFSTGGGKIVCSTSDNRVLVWRLSDRSDSDLTPFVIEREFITDIQGGHITSISMFIAPSSNPYLLCTTSPSRERAAKEGEWSFVAPVGSARDAVPSSLIHDLVLLRKCGPIIASAVSPDCRIMAMVEEYKTNQARLLILPIVPLKDGGLTAGAPLWLDKATLTVRSLQEVKISPTAVRFCPDQAGIGFWLIAVDIEGKIIRKYFSG